jgi:hypothetical protein
MTGMTGFLIAVGVASSIFFVLMLRADRVRNRGRAYADTAGSETGGISPGNDGFSLLNWFNGSSASTSGDSCSSSSFNSGDSGCSDGGGGDGGGD